MAAANETEPDAALLEHAVKAGDDSKQEIPGGPAASEVEGNGKDEEGKHDHSHGEGTSFYAPNEVAAIRVHMQKQTVAKRFLRETVMYFVFVILFCVVAFALRSSWTFYAADGVRQTILLEPFDAAKSNFLDDLDDPGKFFDWAQRVLFPALMPTQWYNGEPLSARQRQFAIRQNRLIGAVRFRQLRVDKGKECTIDKSFADGGLIAECYSAFSSKAMSKADFGMNADGSFRYRNNTAIAPAFKWRSEEALCGRQDKKYCTAVQAGRDAVYPASGYVHDFAQNYSQAIAELAALKAARWIDLESRAILIDFTLVNANVRLMVASSLMVEIFPTGVVGTSASIKPTELLSLPTTGGFSMTTLYDWISFILEVIFVLWVLAYIVREGVEFYGYYKVPTTVCLRCQQNEIESRGLKKIVQCPQCQEQFNPYRLSMCPNCQSEVEESHACWRGFFQDAWNWLDMSNLVLFLVVFGIRFAVRFDLMSVSFDAAPDEFVLFYPLAWQLVFANYLNSVNAMMCFIKVFKYLGKFRGLSALVRTLVVAKNELFNFMVIFLVIFVGFGLTFHLAFGTDISGYRDWTSSMITLFAMLLGDFNYEELERSHRILAPLFFFLYQILVFFVLANMFIAIISGAHAQAKEEMLSGNPDLLSSSLVIFWREFSQKLAQNRFFCFKQNHPLEDLKKVLIRLQESDQLSKQQLSDVRIFRYELQHSDENPELFARIISDFAEHDVSVHENRPYGVAEYDILRFAVQDHKRYERMKRNRVGVWEDDEYDRYVQEKEMQQEFNLHLGAGAADGELRASPPSKPGFVRSPSNVNNSMAARRASSFVRSPSFLGKAKRGSMAPNMLSSLSPGGDRRASIMPDPHFGRLAELNSGMEDIRQMMSTLVSKSLYISS